MLCATSYLLFDQVRAHLNGGLGNLHSHRGGCQSLPGVADYCSTSGLPTKSESSRVGENEASTALLVYTCVLALIMCHYFTIAPMELVQAEQRVIGVLYRLGALLRESLVADLTSRREIIMKIEATWILWTYKSVT